MREYIQKSETSGSQSVPPSGVRATASVSEHRRASIVSEAQRWRRFLEEELPKKVEPAQKEVLLRAWNLMACSPELLGLRFPTAEDGSEGYAFTWLYRDIKGMLSVEVEQDGSALWFLQDAPLERVEPVEWDGKSPLPPSVVEMAQRFLTT